MPNVGLFLPTAAPDARPDTALVFGRAAEAAGLHGVWTLDRLVFKNAEPLMCLAALAGATTRVRLGTSVLLGVLRSPAMLAKMVATLDALSGGRVELGLGVGNRPDDFGGVGVPMAARGRRLAEEIEIMRLAWSGAPVKYEGRAYQLDVGPIGPPPAQPGGPRIWMGGNAPAQLERTGRLADGYIGSSGGGPEGVRAAMERVREAAAAAGRDASALRCAVLVYAHVDASRERAHDLASAYMHHYYPPTRAQVSPTSLLGPPDACIAQAHAYFAAGVDTLIVSPVTADPAALDRLLGEVLTRL